MKILKKILIITLVFNLSRIIVSCCECPADIVKFDYNLVKTEFLRNDSAWTQHSTSDTMYAEAVAFKVMVSDSAAWHFYYAWQAPIASIGFSNAMAFSCDCSTPFKPNYQIEKLSILSLYDVSQNFPAQSDITSLFYLQKNSYGSLYTELPKYLNEIKDKVYFDDPTEELRLFLNTKLENDSARFVVNVKLANGIVFTDTTKTIYILPTPPSN